MSNGYPYTDVNCHYPCAGTGSLIDVIGNPVAKDMTEINTVPEVSDGKFGVARGPIDGRAADPHFERTLDLDGSQYDVRGLVSMTALQWVRYNALNAEPFTWSLWDGAPNAETKQGWVLAGYEVLPGPAGPRFHMYDGVSAFSNIGVYAKPSAPATFSTGVWHLIGGSWDADTNTLACFWGDGSDPTGQTTYYNTVSGFAAGFQFSVDGGVHMGKFSFGGAAGATIVEVDHCSYWKGRAFVLDDWLNHWQNGAGLALDNFIFDPRGPGLAASNYYYGRP